MLGSVRRWLQQSTRLMKVRRTFCVAAFLEVLALMANDTDWLKRSILGQLDVRLGADLLSKILNGLET